MDQDNRITMSPEEGRDLVVPQNGHPKTMAFDIPKGKANNDDNNLDENRRPFPVAGRMGRGHAEAGEGGTRDEGVVNGVAGKSRGAWREVSVESSGPLGGTTLRDRAKVCDVSCADCVYGRTNALQIACHFFAVDTAEDVPCMRWRGRSIRTEISCCKRFRCFCRQPVRPRLTYPWRMTDRYAKWKVPCCRFRL